MSVVFWRNLIPGSLVELNWRGPIWMPVNALLITRCYRSIYIRYLYSGDSFRVECPTVPGVSFGFL